MSKSLKLSSLLNSKWTRGGPIDHYLNQTIQSLNTDIDCLELKKIVEETFQERMDGDKEGGISQIVLSKTTLDLETEEVSEERRLFKERLLKIEKEIDARRSSVIK